MARTSRCRGNMSLVLPEERSIPLELRQDEGLRASKKGLHFRIPRRRRRASKQWGGPGSGLALDWMAHHTVQMVQLSPRLLRWPFELLLG